MAFSRRRCGAWLRAVTAALAFAALGTAQASGGPLGIDHRLNYDDSGIWKRRNQIILQDLAPLVVLADALWKATTRASATPRGRRSIGC